MDEEYTTSLLERYGEDVTQHPVQELQSHVKELHNRVEDVQQKMREEVQHHMREEIQQQMREKMKGEMQRQIAELMK
ncbi:hypothetical protein R6Q57_025614 [Mikania cordata]